MNYLLSIVLLLAFAPPKEKLLAESYHIPKSIREKATLVAIGTYSEGKSPCILMPDGSRRWFLESWFHIRKVYRGLVGGESIYINSAMLPTKDIYKKLDVGSDYLLFLRPSEESIKRIKTGIVSPFEDALHEEEIIAIVKLK